jgi:hypothetical protein
MAATRVKKLPFPDWLLQTDCTVTLDVEGVGRNGEPIGGIHWVGKCIFSEKAERVLDTDGKKILLLGKVIVKGDIAPDLKNVSSGTITLYKGAISEAMTNENGKYLLTEHEQMLIATTTAPDKVSATYEIHKGYRPRNPDGTIHHTMFELK